MGSTLEGKYVSATNQYMKQETNSCASACVANKPPDRITEPPLILNNALIKLTKKATN
jgi:hypothetical protein